jgi:hypothetical protein
MRLIGCRKVNCADSPGFERALGMFRRAPESRLFAPLADAYRDAANREAVRVLRRARRHPRCVSAHVP